MGFEQATLSGKRILITGAGKGIGRHCALACSALDAEVIAVSRTESDLQSLFEESDHRITPWVNDVMSTELLRRIRDLDQLDGLINNAGTNRVGAMVDLDDEDIDAVIDLNVRAAFRVAQASILPMKNSGGGAVVNMSSQMGHVGSPERTLYCMSKHAIEGLTRAMAVELATDGIRVNSVAPTFVLTSLTAPMFDDQAFSDFVMDMIPMRKLATEEEVANACVYLLSDLSGSTTGTCLKVDGGWTAR